MALQIRGIEYRINVKVGRSVESVGKLSTALIELDGDLARVARQFQGIAGVQGVLSRVATDLRTTVTSLNQVLVQQNQIQAQLTGQQNAQTAAATAAAAATTTQASASRAVVAGLNGQNTATAAAAQGLTRQQQGVLNLTNNLRNFVTTTGPAILAQQQMNQNAQTGAVGWNQIAAAIGGALIIRGIRNAVELAGRVQNLNTVMDTVGRTAAISKGELFSTESQMKRLGITTQVSREILTRFAQNNLKVADSLQIARIAQDAAVVAGINSSQAAERMMIAVQRLDTRMLRNLGILINLRSEYQRYALVTGRLENTLNANEKQQIVLNAVMRAGAALAGAYESALQDVYKQFTSLDRKVEEATRTVGEHWLPTFQLAVNVSDFFLEAISNQTAGIDGFIHTIVTAGGGLGLAGIIALVATQVRNLSVALMANPWFAIIAAITTLAVLLIDLNGEQERATQLAIRMGEKQAYERQTIVTLADEIERLNGIKKRTAAQESDLAISKQRVIALLTEEEKATLAATKSNEEYLRALRDVKRFGLPVTASDSQVITKLKSDKAELENLIAKAQQAASSPDERGRSQTQYLRNYVDQLRVIEAEIRAIETQRDTTTLRELDDLATKTQNIDDMAAKARKSLEKTDLQKLFLKGADDLTDRIDLVKDLASATLQLADIDKRSKLKMADAQRKYEGDMDKMKHDGKSDADLSERTLKFDIESASIKQEKEDSVKAFTERQKTLKRILEGVKESLADYNFEFRDTEKIAALAEVGLKDFGHTVVEMDKAFRKSRDGVHVLDQMIQEATDNLRAYQEQVGSGEIKDQAAAARQLAALNERVSLLKQLRDVSEKSSSEAALAYYRDLERAIGADWPAVKELREQTALLRMENELLAQGATTDVIHAITQATEAENKFKDVAEKLTAVMKDRKDALDSLNDRRNKSSDPVEKKLLDQQIATLQGFLKDIDRLWGEHWDHQKEMNEKNQRELDEAQRKAEEEDVKKTEDAFHRKAEAITRAMETAKSKIEKITDDILNATNKTNDDLFKLRLDRGDFGAQTEQVKQAFELFHRFEGLIKGSGNENQLLKIFGDKDIAKQKLADLNKEWSDINTQKINAKDPAARAALQNQEDAKLNERNAFQQQMKKAFGRHGNFQSEFDKSFESIYGKVRRNRNGDVVGNGQRENLYRQMKADLQGAFDKKAQELKTQNEELAKQAEILTENQAQTEILAAQLAQGKSMLDALQALNPAAVKGQKDQDLRNARQQQFDDLRKKHRYSRGTLDADTEAVFGKPGAGAPPIPFFGTAGPNAGLSTIFQGFLAAAAKAVEAGQGMSKEAEKTNDEIVKNLKEQHKHASAAGKAAAKNRADIKATTDQVHRDMQAQGFTK